MPRSQTSKSKSFTPIKTPLPNPMSAVGHVSALPNLPSVGQSLKDGFGLGVGSAVAQRLVTSILGAPTINLGSPQKTPELPCDKERLAFETCMKSKTVDEFCGNEQISYIQCVRLQNS